MGHGIITRRTAFAAVAASAGAALLGGCSRKTEVDRITEANAAIIADLDLAQTTLPLGSVVETSIGRVMVAGHKCIVYEPVGEEAVRRGYEYYGTVWPLGIQFPEQEAVSGVVFSAADIQKVLFIGFVNEEDKDLRAYVRGLEWDDLAEDVVPATAPTFVRHTDVSALEQQLRLQGVRSEELYGEAFGGGLLYSAGLAGEE